MTTLTHQQARSRPCASSRSAAAERDATAFVDRLSLPIEVERVEQPWFRRHRILEIQSGAGSSARRLNVVAQEAGNEDREEEHDKLLAKYGLTRDTEMLYDFDIDLNLRPTQ